MRVVWFFLLERTSHPGFDTFESFGWFFGCGLSFLTCDFDFDNFYKFRILWALFQN